MAKSPDTNAAPAQGQNPDNQSQNSDGQAQLGAGQGAAEDDGNQAKAKKEAAGIPPQQFPAATDVRRKAAAAKLKIPAEDIFAISKAGDVVVTVAGQKLPVPA